LLANSAEGEKTLLWFYYAGHGVMKNLVYAVCTDDSAPYPLEAQLMNLSKTKDCYVLGIFDCCRTPHPGRHRGAAGGSDDDNEHPMKESKSPHNYIFYYGCLPN